MPRIRKGWARLYLDNPVKISRIVLRKASTGLKDFTGGYIQLEVQTIKGRWVTVFEQFDKDVDFPITIDVAEKTSRKAKSVRINFRSPAPITIGPIEVDD